MKSFLIGFFISVLLGVVVLAAAAFCVKLITSSFGEKTPDEFYTGLAAGFCVVAVLIWAIIVQTTQS